MSATWRQWLDQARITDDPAGDFLCDARSDKQMPDVMSSRAALVSYLRGRGACPEALEAVPEVWRRYRSATKEKTR